MPPQEICCNKDGVDPCPNCWEQATFGCTGPCCWCEELEGLCEGTSEYQAALNICQYDWENLTPAQRPCGVSFRVTLTVPNTLTFTSNGGETFQYDGITMENTFGVPGVPSLTTATDEVEYSENDGVFYVSHTGSITGGSYGSANISDANVGGAFPFRGDNTDVRRSGHGGSQNRCLNGCTNQTWVDPDFGETYSCGTNDVTTCSNQTGCCASCSGGEGVPGTYGPCDFEYEENTGWISKESDMETETLRIWDCPNQTVQINVSPDFTMCNDTCTYYGSVELDSGDSKWKYIGLRNIRGVKNEQQIEGASCNQFNCSSNTCRTYAWQCSDCYEKCFDEYCLNGSAYPARLNNQRSVANFDIYDVPITWTAHYHLRAVKFPDNVEVALYPNSKYFWEQTVSLTWTPDWSGIDVAEGTEYVIDATPVDHHDDVTQDQVLQGCMFSGTGSDPYHGNYCVYGGCNKGQGCQKFGNTDQCHNIKPVRQGRTCIDGTNVDCQSLPDEYYESEGVYAPGVNFRKTYIQPDSFTRKARAEKYRRSTGVDWGVWGLDTNYPKFPDPGPDVYWSGQWLESACGAGNNPQKAPGYFPYASTNYSSNCSNTTDYYVGCSCISNFTATKEPSLPSLHAQLPYLDQPWTYEYIWGWDEDVKVTDVTGSSRVYWNMGKFFEHGWRTYNCGYGLNGIDRAAIARKLTPRDENCAPNCPSSTDGDHKITTWSFNGFTMAIGDF